MSVTACTRSPRVSSTIERACGARSIVSVACPMRRLASKSTRRSSATLVTRASDGRAYEWMSIPAQRSSLGGFPGAAAAGDRATHRVAVDLPGVLLLPDVETYVGAIQL